MELFIGKNYSLFQSQIVRYNVSLVKSISEKYDDDPQRAVNLSMTMRKKTKISYTVFKSLDETIVLDKIYSDEFIYRDKEKMEWEIFKEYKTIKGYECQKAATTFAGREYAAWFTKEIPISDGPYKFRGLPGLILEIQDTRKQYVFEFVGLEKNDTEFSFNMKGIPEVTKKEFFKGLNNFKGDIINQLDQRGMTFDEENAKKVRENVKRSRNNQIEIKY